MNASTELLCTIAAPGVEVITLRDVDDFVTTIHGGRLDGESFQCGSDPDGQHERVCRLVRMATWPLASARRR